MEYLNYKYISNKDNLKVVYSNTEDIIDLWDEGKIKHFIKDINIDNNIIKIKVFTPDFINDNF